MARRYDVMSPTTQLRLQRQVALCDEFPALVSADGWGITASNRLWALLCRLEAHEQPEEQPLLRALFEDKALPARSVLALVARFVELDEESRHQFLAGRTDDPCVVPRCAACRFADLPAPDPALSSLRAIAGHARHGLRVCRRVDPIVWGFFATILRDANLIESHLRGVACFAAETSDAEAVADTESDCTA